LTKSIPLANQTASGDRDIKSNTSLSTFQYPNQLSITQSISTIASLKALATYSHPSASKMKSIIAVCSLLVASVAAAPLEARTAPSVTFSLANDQSGANAAASFPADGTSRTIASLFGTSSVASNGHVWATSAQLTAFPQTITCALTNNGVTIADLSAERTFADVDGNPNAAIPVDLTGALINCQA
jgi:hypothetical protein